VTDLFPKFESAYKDNAHEVFRKTKLDELFRIKKKLGDKKHGMIHQQVSAALDLFESSGDLSGFYEPTKTVLGEYYDPMYDYQSNKERQGPILFRGDAESLIDWAKMKAGKTLH
jgi:tRNA 2-selenouridine synthase